MSGRLAGRTAIITGGGSGLGRASVLRFAAEGAAVVVADRDVAAAESVVAEVSSAGGSALAVEVDVTDLASNEAMVAAAVNEFGVVDVLFANAGIPGNGNADTTTEDEFDRVIAVNLKGVWLSARAVLPHLVERGGGSIINQASMGGMIGLDGIFPYTAAKGAVIAMTKQMAIAHGPANVRVNAICPGTIPTPLVRAARETSGVAIDPEQHLVLDAEAAMRFPLRRLGVPDDVANLAVFLASDESSWITGGIFPVDGGRSAA